MTDFHIKINEEQKQIIQQHIDWLKIRLDQWKLERKKAYAARKDSADKYYKSITERIKHIEKQVEYYEQKIHEFELALEKGEI